MSECKVISSDEPQSQSGENDQVSKYFRSYSSMGFLRKGRNKRKQSRSNLCSKPKEFNESDKKTVNMVAKKGEVLGLEEVSNEFTCSSSIMETYHLNANKEAKFSFRKLEDGTFALETKSELNPDKSESGILKRSTKTRQKKGRSSYKPLKICLKKRSKALRKSSDSNDEYKADHKTLTCPTPQEDNSCVVGDECSEQDQTKRKTWATLKSLVTRRRKLRSSVKRQSQLSGRHLEADSGNASTQQISKEKRFSNMKIPCMNFSRGKRSTNNPLPTEDTLCTVKSSDTSGTDSGPDCGRNDKALAVKYKLQKTLDIENGKIGNNLDDGLQTSMDPKAEDIDNMCRPLSRNSKIIQSIQETSRPKLNENLSISDGNQPVTESQKRNREKSLKNREDDLDVPLISEISIKIDSPSDVYEMLLKSTAASLVNTVIESSIQKFIEEETFLNHVPCKASGRFYI